MKHEQLKNYFTKLMKDLKPAIENYNWDDRNAYATWLANSYHYAFNSTRILSLAAGQMPPHLTRLSNRFIQHAAEEKGHEKLLEQDVRSLGFKMPEIQVSHEAKLFYQSLYYWLSGKASPVGLLGWILALEGIAVYYGAYIYDRCQTAHGKMAATFLKVHSAEDPGHLESAFKAIQNLQDPEIDLIMETALQYCKQYSYMLNSNESFENQQKAA